MMIEDLIDDRYVKFYENLLEQLEQVDYYVFISRKCYFYSKIVQEHDPGLLEKREKVKAKNLRDRDMFKEKIYNLPIEGKKILLIDDTMYTGNTLLSLCKRIESWEQKPQEISIMIFAIVADMNLLPRIKEELGEKYRVQTQELFTYREMSELLIKQLQAVQSFRHSYVIDLPVFKEMDLPLEKFELLTSSYTSGWIFTEYQVKVVDQNYDNGFFAYDNRYIKRIMGQDLLELVVKCRYDICTDDQGQRVVHCSFTPFAMLRSMDYDTAKEYFQALFAGSDYERHVMSADRMENYVTIYRSVVYALSYFTGKAFEQYVQKITGHCPELILNLSDLDINQMLKKRMDEIFGDFSIGGFYSYMPRKESKMEDSMTVARGKLDMNLKEIQLWFMELVYDAKRKYILQMQYQDDEPDQGLIVSQEMIEDTMNRRYGSLDKSFLKKCLVCVLLKGLDTGVVSNNLNLIDGVIIRSFKLGESSDILCEHDMKAFYAAIYTYYNRVGIMPGRYQEKYKRFIANLKNFFSAKEYFRNQYISDRTFRFFSEYYDLNDKALYREIANKRYLLQRNLSHETGYIKEVIDFVNRLELD